MLPVAQKPNPQSHLAAEAAVHLPRPAIVPTNTALGIATLPALASICKADRVVINVSCRGNEYQWQPAGDSYSLAAGRIVVVDSTHNFMLVILKLDSEAVIGRATVSIRGCLAFVLLVLLSLS